MKYIIIIIAILVPSISLARVSPAVRVSPSVRVSPIRTSPAVIVSPIRTSPKTIPARNTNTNNSNTNSNINYGVSHFNPFTGNFFLWYWIFNNNEDKKK